MAFVVLGSRDEPRCASDRLADPAMDSGALGALASLGMPEPSNQQRALGGAIRYIREREGMTQEDLAHGADVHATWVSRIESGRFDPRWSSVRQLAIALDVKLLEIVALAEANELD